MERFESGAAELVSESPPCAGATPLIAMLAAPASASEAQRLIWATLSSSHQARERPRSDNDVYPSNLTGQKLLGLQFYRATSSHRRTT